MSDHELSIDDVNMMQIERFDDLQDQIQVIEQNSKMLKAQKTQSAQGQSQARKASDQASQFQMCLDLFTRIPDPKYSNTIELYDLLPKFLHQQDRKVVDLSQAELVRNVKINGTEYKVVMRAAIMKDDKGNNVLVYPSQREEIVEMALRKIAVNGQASLVTGDHTGVYFTLGQLQRELKASNHGYNISEIKEAIMICSKAGLDVYTANGESLISSSIFPIVALRTKEDWKNNPQDSQCLIVFNPLVSQSISALTFRLYDYEKNMGIKSQVGRYMHRRLTAVWKQASDDNPYTFLMNQMLLDSNRGLSARSSENIRAMKNALDSLVNAGMIRPDYQMIKLKNGKAVVDVKCILYPTESFVKEMKLANKVQKQNNGNVSLSFIK